MLKSLDCISVREVSLGEEIKKIFPDLRVWNVPDPVFLLSEELWKSVAIKPRLKTPYAFFYQAETSVEIGNMAKEIAKKRELQLLILSADVCANNSKECHASSPREFLGWILDADFIITSSFHAVAFCIIFQKDFCAIKLNDSDDKRLCDLLSIFGLEGHLVETAQQYKKQMSYLSKEKIRNLQLQAIDYLSRVF